MNSSSQQSEVFVIRPPTPAEVDHLATISAISFILGALAFFCVVGVALAVALKTKVPGRWAILLSVVFLSAWWALVQFMGGDLDGTFGPVGLLVTYTVYSAFTVVFAFGYLRMSFAIFKQRAAQVANTMQVFTVYCGHTLVGHTALENGDPPMRVAFGRFIPGEAYRAIQRLCIDNPAEQSALNLTVKTPSNETIQCAGVGILDYSEEAGEEGIEINVLGISHPPYEQLFPHHVVSYEQQFK